MTEKWEHWEPIKGLFSRYNMLKITEGIRTFKIILYDLENPKNRVHIRFKKVDSYRRTDESLRGFTICALKEKYGTAFFETTFFKVTNSEYAKWLSEQSFTFSDSLPLIHFSFIDDNAILDVISCSEPEVKLITGKTSNQH